MQHKISYSLYLSLPNSLMKNKTKFQTRAVHAGEALDPVTGASSPNIVMSTTFAVDADAGFSLEAANDTENSAPRYTYTRWGNPTLNQLEKKLSSLEEAADCVVFASGMAAISALFFSLFKMGDHLVMSDIVYAGASELANDTLANLGIEVTRVNMSDLDEVAAAMTSKTKLVYAESPCNPIMRLTNLAAVAEIAHSHGAKLAVDSTFATPMATMPITLGADYVIHSLTKYFGGHGDAIGGAVLGNDAAEMGKLRQGMLGHGGGVLSPFNAWLIMRGMATLPLRMAAHEKAALAVAEFLENHPKIERVVYPGLASHPQSDLAQEQMHNMSGMLTFQTKDGPAAARVFAKTLEIFHYAVSLGHHRSLLFYMPTDSLLETSFKLTPKQAEDYRRYMGDGAFRVSVGIEDGEDLCDDLARVLEKI